MIKYNISCNGEKLSNDIDSLIAQLINKVKDHSDFKGEEDLRLQLMNLTLGNVKILGINLIVSEDFENSKENKERSRKEKVSELDKKMNEKKSLKNQRKGLIQKKGPSQI